ncbi:MAG: GAF domain-containing protein, partial [Geitlerinemataceae cyanobacterium]
MTLEIVENLIKHSDKIIEISSEDTKKSNEKISDRFPQKWQFLYRAIACYLWQNPTRATEWLDCLNPDLNTQTHELEWPIFHLYHALSQLAMYDEVSLLEQPQILERVEVDIAQIQLWLDRYPTCSFSEYELVLAEFNRVRGHSAEAIEYFDRAIASAQKLGNICIEALSNELAGKFYLNWEKPKIAKVYLTDAYQLYDRLGARAKAEDLSRRYLHKLPSSPKNSIATDWAEAMQLSQTLSGALHLDKLLVVLMQMAIEKTGADMGISILVQGDRLAIAARCDRASATPDFPANCNLQSIPIETATTCVLDVPQSVIDYVRQTQQPLLITEEILTDSFAADPYFRQRRPKSLLCLPTIDRGKMKGMIYLENYTHADAFSGDRLEILQLLATQAAISLENAQLYARIEDYSRTLAQRVAERTEQLQQEVHIRNQTE